MSQFTPPHDIAAERGVLGGCLVHGAEVVAEVVDQVEPEHFYDRKHQKIFHAIAFLWDQGEPVDEITVTSLLSDQHQLESIGGASYLAELAEMLLGPAHVGHYAKLVRQKAKLRDAAKAAQRILQKISSNGTDPETLLEEAQAEINRASTTVHAGQLVSMADLIPRVFADYQERQGRGVDPRAVPMGFSRLDGITGGMRPGNLILAAGRPGMGKTAFMAKVAGNVAIHQGKPVLFASLEQTEGEMGARIVCAEMQIDTREWSTGRVSTGQYQAAEYRQDTFSRAPLYWLCGRGVKARSLLAKARALQASKGLALVVVDYVQLMAARQNDEAISEVSQAMKAMAMDLRVPVLAASQLNREVEKRDPPKPQLSDLRGSGSLEQDSDIVLFFYRPGYYDTTADPKVCEVIVAKHRGGPVGKVYLDFIKEYTRFEDQGGDSAAQGEMSYGQANA